jgi:hypothetical protein
MRSSRLHKLTDDFERWLGARDTIDNQGSRQTTTDE